MLARNGYYRANRRGVLRISAWWRSGRPSVWVGGARHQATKQAIAVSRSISICTVPINIDLEIAVTIPFSSLRVFCVETDTYKQIRIYIFVVF